MTNTSFVRKLSFQLARSASAITEDCLRELSIFLQEGMYINTKGQSGPTTSWFTSPETFLWTPCGKNVCWSSAWVKSQVTIFWIHCWVNDSKRQTMPTRVKQKKKSTDYHFILSMCLQSGLDKLKHHLFLTNSLVVRKVEASGITELGGFLKCLWCRIPSSYRGGFI